MLKRGPYKLSLKKLIQNPNGIDLGPLKTCLQQKLRTPDRKLDLAPDICIQGFQELKQAMAKEDGNNYRQKFQLIGRRNLRSNNSWMHNCVSLRLKSRDFHILISKQDGERLGLDNGDKATVTGWILAFLVAAFRLK